MVHGDDADSHRRRTLYNCTISSPVTLETNAWDSRVLLVTFDNHKALPQTFDTIDAWLVHGLTELQEGRFMTVDPWNQPHNRGHVGRVIGPYIGVLVGLKGDEKFIQRTLKVIASPISDQVCMYCEASQKGPNIYTLHGAGAPHRSTLVSNESFFTTGCHSNSWLRLPGFHISRVFLDWLHLVDLSLIPECSASVPWHSSQSCLYGGVLLSGVKVYSLPRLKPLIWGIDRTDSYQPDLEGG